MAKAKIARNLLIFMITCLVLMPSIALLGDKINQLNGELRYEKVVRIPVGKYLNAIAPENATIYLEPIGIIGYYSKRYIYDDAGLVSPSLIPFNKLNQNAKNVYLKIDFTKPDFLIIRNRDLNEFINTTMLLHQYEKKWQINYYKNSVNIGMSIFQRKSKSPP